MLLSPEILSQSIIGEDEPCPETKYTYSISFPSGSDITGCYYSWSSPYATFVDSNGNSPGSNKTQTVYIKWANTAVPGVKLTCQIYNCSNNNLNKDVQIDIDVKSLGNVDLIKLNGTPRTSYNLSCKSSSAIALEVPPVTNADSYIWSLPPNWTASSTTTRVITAYPSNLDGGTIRVKAKRNDCPDFFTERTLVITRTEFPVVTLSTNFNDICKTGSNANRLYSVIGEYADFYVWETTGNLKINGNSSPYSTTSTSVTISANSGSPQGLATIKVKADGGVCGQSPQSQDDIWVGKPSGITGSLSGPSSVSEWDLTWYSVPSQSQQSGTFDWTVPFGFYQTAGGDGYRNIQVWIQSYAQSGYVQVWKTNVCGNGGAKYKYVTVTTGGGCGICPITQTSPNPASDRIDISFIDRETNQMIAKQNFEEPREYVITDFMGTVVLSYQSKQTKLKLDISQVKREGVYVLNIKHGSLGTDRYRLIIER